MGGLFLGVKAGVLYENSKRDEFSSSMQRDRLSDDCRMDEHFSPQIGFE
jgi:hypothetical protein